MLLTTEIKLSNEDALEIARAKSPFTTSRHSDNSQKITKYTPNSLKEPQPWTKLVQKYR